MGKPAPYLFQKRGVYYLQKRIPQQLVPKLGRVIIRKSLRTRCRTTSIKTAGPILNALDREWHEALFTIPDGVSVMDFLTKPRISEPTLREATEAYLEMKGKADSVKFTRPIELVVSAIIKQSGNKSLSAYTRNDAIQFRDSLIKRKVSLATVKRNLSVIRSVWNFASREHGINALNPFSNMNYGNASEAVRRLPIPSADIQTVQMECQAIDDDIRWLIALISDSGMRLSEAAGLCLSDIQLDTEIPFIKIMEHPWRSLKTPGSTRQIPLVGYSLWAAYRAISNTDNQFLFPRYCSDTKCKSDYASNTLNKWLRAYVPDGCVIHSFRHSLRDRLRAAQCPSDIIDQIGGWQTAGVGQGYGDGYKLDVLGEWMACLQRF